MVMASLGVEPEGLGGVAVAGGGPLEGEARGGEEEAVADGLRHVPPCDDRHSGADHSHGGKDRLSAVGLESLAAVFFRLLDQLRRPLRC